MESDFNTLAEQSISDMASLFQKEEEERQKRLVS